MKDDAPLDEKLNVQEENSSLRDAYKDKLHQKLDQLINQVSKLFQEIKHLPKNNQTHDQRFPDSPTKIKRCARQGVVWMQEGLYQRTLDFIVSLIVIETIIKGVKPSYAAVYEQLKKLLDISDLIRNHRKGWYNLSSELTESVESTITTLIELTENEVGSQKCIAHVTNILRDECDDYIKTLPVDLLPQCSKWVDWVQQSKLEISLLASALHKGPQHTMLVLFKEWHTSLLDKIDSLIMHTSEKFTPVQALQFIENLSIIKKRIEKIVWSELETARSFEIYNFRKLVSAFSAQSITLASAKREYDAQLEKATLNNTPYIVTATLHKEFRLKAELLLEPWENIVNTQLSNRTSTSQEVRGNSNFLTEGSLAQKGHELQKSLKEIKTLQHDLAGLSILYEKALEEQVNTYLQEIARLEEKHQKDLEEREENHALEMSKMEETYQQELDACKAQQMHRLQYIKDTDQYEFLEKILKSLRENQNGKNGVSPESKSLKKANTSRTIADPSLNANHLQDRSSQLGFFTGSQSKGRHSLLPTLKR